VASPTAWPNPVLLATRIPATADWPWAERLGVSLTRKASRPPATAVKERSSRAKSFPPPSVFMSTILIVATSLVPELQGTEKRDHNPGVTLGEKSGPPCTSLTKNRNWAGL